MARLDSLGKIEVISLNKVIQEKVKDYIRHNELTAGDKLPTEAELAARIGVSRTAIREALRGLEALGIIEVQHGSGRYIRHIDFSEIIDDLAYTLELTGANLKDLLEIRSVLETSFLPETMEYLTAQDLAELDEILMRMGEKVDQGKPFVEEDMAFHQCLFRHTDNQLLKQLLYVFWRLFSEALPESLQVSEHNDAVLERHRRLRQAVGDKDRQRAVRLLQSHFNDVKQRLQSE